MSSENIWVCKIGGPIDELPMGADSPMRRAVEEAFYKLTGRHAEFTFSGWAGSLTEGERAVIENRLPDYDKVMAEERAAPETKPVRHPDGMTDEDDRQFNRRWDVGSSDDWDDAAFVRNLKK